MFSSGLLVVLGMMPSLLFGNRTIAQSAQPVATSLMSITPVEGGLDVYRPNEAIAWNIWFSGPGRDVYVSYVIRDWKGDVKQEGHDLRAIGNHLLIDSRLKELGWFELTVTAIDSSNQIQGRKALGLLYRSRGAQWPAW